jgi:hypothetical protein
VAGIAAATTVGVFLAGGLGTTVGISSAAAATLRRAAAKVATDPSIPQGDYLYTHSNISELELTQQTGSSPDTGYNITGTEETWVNDVGEGRLRTSQTSIEALPGDNGSQVLPALQQPINLTFGSTYGESFPDIVNPSGWPTQPGALRTAIEQRLDAGATKSYTTFLSTTYLLSEAGSSALRSACYQVLATLPGLSDYGSATDSLGRTGHAVGMTFEGIRTAIILNTSTGALLQVTNAVAIPGASDVPAYKVLAAGTVLNTKTLTDQTVVSSATSEP